MTSIRGLCRVLLVPVLAAPAAVGLVSHASHIAAATTGYPSTPPAVMCGSAAMAGPTAAPAGAVVVTPGGTEVDALTQANPPGTTFYLLAGTHTLGTPGSPGIYDQVIAKDNDTYIGAPGAVIDGHNVARFAFTQQAANVTISNLTIQNFGAAGDNNNEGVVNHDGGSGWHIKYDTIQGNAGAGVFIGSNDVISYNCLVNNGQYGFSMYKPVQGSLQTITLDHNEIAGNNTYDWETRIAGCGCSGGGKFWDAHNVTVTNNWVHDNKSVGLWADTNNYGFVIDGNYIANNDAEGIFFELSYNARITNNTLTRNAIVKGKAFAARNDAFPVGAIYVSESGGDTRVNGGVNPTITITGNSLVDNWGGVALWENADRFCGGGSSTAYCTLVNPAQVNMSTCTPTNINSSPYLADCRWKTQNVNVSGNQLSFHKANVGCTTGGCGQQALLSNYGSYPSWSPYPARVVQDAIMYHQNNHFSNNTYIGDWVFTPYETATNASFAAWQAAPYSQDQGSTFSPSGSPPTTTTLPATTTTTLPAPPSLVNALGPDTSGLEGSIGLWVPWYSALASQSNAQAHTGTHSLRVDITNPWGWGVQLNAWPGLATTPGNKTIGFWGRLGSGTNLAATMTVRWRDILGTELKADTVTLSALSGTWRQATANVTAPAGTAAVKVDVTNGSGLAGDSLYLDDFTVVSAGPPPALVNVLDPATAGLEGSLGTWSPWFSANVSQSNLQAHSGTGSMRVDITAPYGWGAQLESWPGVATTPGAKTIGFWGRVGGGTNLAVTMTVRWRTLLGNDLQVDRVALPALSGTWQQATANLTAPIGTTSVQLELTSTSGVAGDSLYLDDFVVAG